MNIVNFFDYFLKICFWYFVMDSFLEKRESLGKLIKIFFFMLMAVIDSRILFLFPALSIVNVNLTILSMVFLLFTNPFLKKLTISVLLMLYMVFIEVFVSLLLSSIFDLNEVLLKESRANDYYGMLCWLVIIISIMLIILLRSFQRKNKFYASRMLYIYQISIPILSIVFVELVFLKSLSEDMTDRISLFFTMFTMAVINIIVYYMFQLCEKLYQNNYIEQLNLEMYKNREDYYKKLERHQEEIRIIKHDFKNQLLAIEPYINEPKIKQDINRMLKVINSYGRTLVFTMNVAVNSMLSKKYLQAQELGIECDFEILFPEKMQISPKDISSLLGNILDNAIEAVENMDKGYIKLKLLYYKSFITIEIENPVLERVVELSTKKSDTWNHGLGLKSVDGIVKKYNGLFEWHSDENVFRLSIILWDIIEKQER